ncbi:hypothetical protein JVU11DRAFT_8742 [Chiua virens]|nr:hypothetical protein JVU11DRAFT_8742 [Chiua virens]
MALSYLTSPRNPSPISPPTWPHPRSSHSLAPANTSANTPEHELENERILLLRRLEPTWRKEFILRSLANQTLGILSEPDRRTLATDSSVDGVHLISEHGLLTSSVQYGIVARSIPFNGKVLKGYIDASGTGLGIGNPNVEFTPNVSVCTMTSDGGTARVFWGKRNGEVALTVANRVMDSRAASKFIRCGVDDQHEGVVQQVVPDSGVQHVPLWDTKSLKLLWSTDKHQVSLVADPFIAIAGSLTVGFVVGALKSGDIFLYDLPELETSKTPSDGPCIRSVHQLRISPLINNKVQSTAQVYESSPQQQVAKMWLYRIEEASFYRVLASIQSRDVTITPFGSESFANISALEPVFSTDSRDNDMILVGDLLGFVGIYDASVSSQTFAEPVHRFEAHDDPVTAIAWSPVVFATGTVRGATTVWDSLTLEPMRCFTSPAPRPAPGHDWDGVSRILVDKEFIIIVVGNRVLTWKVGHGSGREYQHKKTKHANTKLNVTKGHRKYEMYKDIAESYRELDGPQLDALGLSETEAVEYVLMLSREEEEARQQGTVIDEGVPGPNSSTPVSPRHSFSERDRQYPRVSPPISNEKVQVSPPFIPEPMEAGTSISPLRSLTLPSPMTTRSPQSSLDHFPAISSSLSSTSSSRQRTPASPGQPRSVWSTPLKSVLPLPGPSSPRSRVVAPAVARTPSSDMSLLSADIARHKNAFRVEVQDDDMDEDLKLAIELSLAETRSSGKAVIKN